MISLQEQEEIRQELLQEAWEEEREYEALSSDKDKFYDYLTANYVDELDDIRYRIEGACERYGYDADEWFAFLTEK